MHLHGVATKPRPARTLPTLREYPSFQTSASDAVAFTRACPNVLRSTAGPGYLCPTRMPLRAARHAAGLAARIDQGVENG